MAHSKTTRRAGNPVAFAVMKAALQRDITSLLTAAELQATWGDAPTQTIDRCGRVLFIVSFAVGRCRIPDDTPEVRVLRAMANVITELALDHSSLDQHRAAITSGLQAVQRLLPRLSVWSLGEGSLVLDETLQRGHQPDAHEFDQLIKAPAALPAGA
jgi:hypothetical protein